MNHRMRLVPQTASMLVAELLVTFNLRIITPIE